MIQDINNPIHYIADEGKEFMRIADNFRYGNEIYLGYSYYINGELQTPPHLDVIEDFIEVEIPEDEYNEEIEN